MVRNLTVIWAPLLFALLLTTTVQTEENSKQLRDKKKVEDVKVEERPQTQQKHSNAIMGEAGVTNSPMVDNPLAANYHYYYDKNNNRQLTDDVNQYDAPDDCHFAPYELSTTTQASSQTTTTTTIIPITTTTTLLSSSSLITTTTTSSVSTTTNHNHNNNNNYYQQHEDITLTCNLRTVNSEFDTTNFSVIPAEHTLGLNVLCNNEIMAKSALESNSFAHLLRLRELTLKYCKFSKLPQLTLNGLTELRNLTVRTFNILWPTLNLDIEAGAFDAVKQLQRLDLSTNNIWTLPAGVFCTLPALIMLNVSFNSLQDVNELGFREFNHITTTTTATATNMNMNIDADADKAMRACNLDLEILDCSRNNFVILPPYGFSALKRLRILFLQHNEINMLAEHALSGLKNLQIFNANSNNIAALRSGLFQEQMESIQEIYLANNSISVLTPNLFANLKQLQALDLSFNKIISTWTNNETFIGLIRLVSLNLSHNRLTNLTSEIFIDLYTLQILNLRHNQLEQLQPHTFAPLHNLHTLLLSHNKLKFLDANALNGLYVLSLLSLDNNQLTALHDEAFRNCSSLQDLNLNGNQLEGVPLALGNMHLLRTVDLGENRIRELTASSFEGLNNLHGLRLISNQLTNISKVCFENLTSLQILNLARNSISYVEPAAFDLIPDVQAIRLDGNQLKNIDHIFMNMPSLLWLNISDNQLEYFDYAQIPNSLQWLDLHRNQLKELVNSLESTDKFNIQTLDLSFNKLQRINGASLPNSLRLLFLNNNQVTTVEPDTFIHKVNITRVDLYENHISTLDIKSLRITAKPKNDVLPEFYIGGNPYICDCNIDWLQKINYMRTQQYPRIMDLDTVFCKLLNNREHAFIPLVQAQPKHFLCNYKTHCFAVCHCCEFDACDCEMTCPNKCTCFHDQTWSTNIVECSGANYTETPSKVPMDTSELYMDGNNLIELNGYAFLGRKNLEVLYINASNVQFIYNTTFSGLKRLKVLHLENNYLEMLQGSEFYYLENLRALYLQNNNIYSIYNGTFQMLHKLQILRLDGNRLVHFEVWQLLHNPLLMEIGLTDNQWSCECNYLMKFRNFLKYSANKILNLAHVSCIYNNATSVLIEQNGTKCIINGHDINIENSFLSTASLEQLLQILLVATFVFIAFFGAIFSVIHYRQQHKNWRFNICNVNFCQSNSSSVTNMAHDVMPQKERLNDAYFVYSLQDDQFVCQIIAAVLERDIGYRLILHYRDIHMKSYLANSLLETADTAKMLFIVLSKNFLYNEWSRFDYKAALHELIIKRRNRLAFILYGDLPQRDIDPEMRHFLRISTCIEWDDKKFWCKLRNTMPANLRPKSNNNERLRSNVSLYTTQVNQSTHTHTHTLNSQHNPSLLMDKRYATVNERTAHAGGGRSNSLLRERTEGAALPLPLPLPPPPPSQLKVEPSTTDCCLNDCNCTKMEICTHQHKLTGTFSTNFVSSTIPVKRNADIIKSRPVKMSGNVSNISLININTTLEQKKQSTSHKQS